MMPVEGLETLINKGKDCLNRGQFQLAETILLEALEKDKHSAEVYFQLGSVFNSKGEIGKAIKAYKKVLSLDKQHTDASIALSILYNDIGKYEEAKVIFEQANERVKSKAAKGELLNDGHVNRKFSQKHFELGDLYLTYNRFDEALFEFNKAFSLNPENLEARIKVAKIYSKKGFVAKAFEELKQLKNEHPFYMEGRVALGVLYFANGKIVEAQNEWEKVLAKEPQHEEANMYLNLSQTASETRLN